MSRSRAQALILAGEVKVNGETVRDKAYAVRPTDEISLSDKRRFVSRGGEKLAGALERLDLEPASAKAIDLGASTGGFTDCLLQRGAASVIAVDVGYGQLDWKLRNDSRVTVMEKTNVRELQPSALPYAPDLAVIDLSFISTAKVLPAVLPLLAPGARLLVLVKPQFEGSREDVGKGGIVREAARHEAILSSFLKAAAKAGLRPEGMTWSEPKGPKGNIEFFVSLLPGEATDDEATHDSISVLVRKAHEVLNGKGA